MLNEMKGDNQDDFVAEIFFSMLKKLLIYHSNFAYRKNQEGKTLVTQAYYNR